MRAKWFGLFGIILAFALVAGPLAGVVLASSDHDAPHAGHDMSTMEDMTYGSSTGENGNYDDAHAGHDMGTMEDMPHDSSGHTGDDHGSTSSGDHGGHGGELQDPNAPPNWPVIYGFGGFNLLVIIVAALLKSKGLGVS